MSELHEFPRFGEALVRSLNLSVRRLLARDGLDIWDLALPSKMKAPFHEHTRPFFSILADGWIENDYRRERIPFHPFLNVYHPTGTVHATAAGPHGARILTLEISAEWERRAEGFVRLP